MNGTFIAHLVFDVLDPFGNSFCRACVQSFPDRTVMILQVAEISRVLRPGGVFVASTTIADGPLTLLPFRRYLREVN